MQTAESLLFKQEEPSLWATVILPLAVPIVYTYAIPNKFLQQALPGCRVEVVFGKAKKYAGVIKERVTQNPAYPTKEILNVLDDEPLLFPQQLLFWNWLSSYYMCSEGEVMAAALPANFKLSSETTLIYNEAIAEEFSSLNNNEFLVAEALLIKKQLQLTEVQQILDSKFVYPVIKSLLDKEVCFIWEELTEKYKVKKESFVSLHPNMQQEENLAKVLNEWKGAPKQMSLMLAFLHFSKTEEEVLQSELLKKADASNAQLNGLVQKNILVVQKKNVNRIKMPPKNLEVHFSLNAAQQEALAAIELSFTQKDICLLHGVTGSGKTLLYIKLIETYLKKGQQILYLLPEIALTTQIIRRLLIHFGGHIAIYHSRFNNQERIELWNKVRNSEVKIVLGARSALFLPFSNLGFVIVDEEHDASYKQQDPAPRYQARDAAIYYASIFKAKVLLGTATPSLESYYNAVNNKYGLVQLTERFGGLQLPKIELVNTLQVAASQKGKVMLSPQLKEKIAEAIQTHTQVILFQNRRGYHPYLICGTCGKIPKCNHCDVSLTLHKYSNKLQCHYCGSNYPKLVACPDCGSVNWVEKSFGTEKIEEQLEEDFATAKIARMDVDSVRGKTAHDSLIMQFEQHKIDMLVGTQMVVKGLDFDMVSLVGVLDADGLLNFADFRANERAFQLMEQVSGRAGRKHKQGLVLIQTAQVKHPVLEMVKQHDFKGFYHFEMENRQLFFYPPFSRLLKLTLKHKDKNRVTDAAQKLANYIQQDLGTYLIGPAAPVIGRIRNLYLMELMLKLPKTIGTTATYKRVIRNHINLLQSEKEFKGVQVLVDVDPV